MPRRTRKHAQRRKSPGSKLKNKEGAEGCQGDSPQGIGALACTLRQNPKLSQFRHCVDIICGIIPLTNPSLTEAVLTATMHPARVQASSGGLQPEVAVSVR